MASVVFEGLEVDVVRGGDGTLVVSLTGPGDGDLTSKEAPDIRIWLNEALIYAHGEVGNDLSDGRSAKVADVANEDH